MNKLEIVNLAKKQCGGSVALQQALRSLGYSYQAIGDLVGVSKRTAWNNCNGIKYCKRWEDRLGKSEMQEFAAQMVKNLKNGEKL
jgi:hypothetical protein